MCAFSFKLVTHLLNVSALESFIRNKYERKLYIKKDGEPPENPKSTVDRLKSDNKEEKEKEKKVF